MDPEGTPEPSLKDSLSSYAAARAELFAIEGKEAAAFAGRKGTLLASAAGGFLFGYILLLVSLVSVIGNAITPYLKGDFFIRLGAWPLVTIIFSAIHFLVGYILVKKAGRMTSQTLFTFSKAELQKDKHFPSLQK